MKRLVIVLLVISALLGLFSSALCKGELGDADAFTVYMGRTKNEVRRIAPEFTELVDNIFIVDSLVQDDDLIGLGVTFDDYNLVDNVVVLMTPGAMKLMDLKPDLNTAASAALVFMGFSSDDLIKSSTDSDGDLFLTLKGGISVLASLLSEGLYLVIASQ